MGASGSKGQIETCHDYVLLEARDTFEKQGPSRYLAGMVNNTLATVPNGTLYDVVYPASPDLTQLTTLMGSTDINHFFTRNLAHCPDQKYSLLGYSQGATVVNEALQKIDSSNTTIFNAIQSIVLIGNPYHLKDKRGNVDQFGGNSTAPFDGILYLMGITIPDMWYRSGKVLDICHTDDPVCKGIDLSSLFDFTHLEYADDKSVQMVGGKFLIDSLT